MTCTHREAELVGQPGISRRPTQWTVGTPPELLEQRFRCRARIACRLIGQRAERDVGERVHPNAGPAVRAEIDPWPIAVVAPKDFAMAADLHDAAAIVARWRG